MKERTITNHYKTANIDQTYRNFSLLPNPASTETIEDFAAGAAGARNVNKFRK